MTTSFERERALFAIAKDLGYPGIEPSVLGIYTACTALNDVKEWLSNREPPAGQVWRRQWWEYLEPSPQSR